MQIVVQVGFCDFVMQSALSDLKLTLPFKIKRNTT